MAETRSMEVSFEPRWEKIENTRNAVAAYCNSLDLPGSLAQATVMVVSELAENAIKYGSFSKGGGVVKTVVSLEDDDIIVEVIHPVDRESYSHLVQLDKTIQWIRGFQDPFEAYIEKLREISRRDLADYRSGLGLARIAYEAQAFLDFFVDEDDMLNISAISNGVGAH